METNAATKDATHVLIIGAGVTGLAIAHGLQKAGISYAIYDHEPSAQTYRPREWTMGIHWALPLLESLLPDELASRLNEAYVDSGLDWNQEPCDRMRMYNGLTGEIMKDVPIKGKIVRVSRRKLRAFLTQDIEIKYDHSLVDIKYNDDGNSVTAIFANGAQETGTLIVGADGPRSAVRNQLFGGETAAPMQLDRIIHTNVTYCPGDAEKANFIRSTHPVWSIVMHPELFSMLSIQDVPDADKPETWKFQVIAGWLGDRDSFPTAADRMEEVKRKGALLPEPFKSAVQWIPNDTPITFDQINYWDSTPWDTHNGRVTLAGDAAHPMPPHRGQGLNHALQDAHNLVTLLSSQRTSAPSPAAKALAITTFSNEVATRGAEEVALSRQNAFMVLNWQQLEQSPVFKHALDKSPKTDSVQGSDGEDDKKDAEKVPLADPVYREQVRHVEREMTAIAGA